MKRKDYLYIFLLIMIPLLFLFIITSQNLLFGNKVDWFNQHITIADALRHAIREEGTIFPTYLSHLMSGVNIYYFSYYGLLMYNQKYVLFDFDMFDSYFVCFGLN